MTKSFLMVASLFFYGCGDPFPSEKIFKVDQAKQTCREFKINKDTIEISYSKEIKFSECPIIYGFTPEETGKVMAWGRRVKNKLNECN